MLEAGKEARVQALRGDEHRLPALVWGSRRSFVTRALADAGFPMGFVRFVSELYSVSELRSLVGERVALVSAAGFSRGAPLDGEIFVVAADPLVAALAKIPKAEGLQRANADDFATVFRLLQALAPVFA